MAPVIKRLLAFLACAIFGTQAGAADCPQPPCFQRPVTVVVPFAAGGTADLVARVWGAQLSRQIGQPVVVENKGGAGGMIGAQLVAKSPPDSHTILVTNQAPITIAPYVYSRPSIEPSRDLVPAAQIAVSAQALVARSDAPFKNLKELVAYSKAQSKGVNYGSAGPGTIGHLLGEHYKATSGAAMTHVSYRGAGPALTDLLGGQVEVMFADPASVASEVRNGRLRVLAVTGERRGRMLPDVPTFAEQGIPGMDAMWFGAFFPANTHPAIVSRLNTETRRALSSPEVASRLHSAGLEISTLDTESFAEVIRAESIRWSDVVKRAHIRAE